MSTTTTRVQETPKCDNCESNLAVVFKPMPVDLYQGRYTLVMPAFECAACGERIVISTVSPEYDARLPGAMIYANY